MQSFARLDDGLIDRVFQPVMDWIAGRLALGWSRVACFGTDLSALAWVLSQADGVVAAFGLPGAGAGRAQGVPTFNIVLIVVGLASIMVLRTLFQRAGGGRAGQGGNPLRAGMQVHRAMGLFWLAGLSIKTATGPAGFGAWALLAVGVFGTMALYVAACVNPPPRRVDARAADRAWRLAPAIG